MKSYLFLVTYINETTHARHTMEQWVQDISVAEGLAQLAIRMVNIRIGIVEIKAIEKDGSPVKSL